MSFSQSLLSILRLGLISPDLLIKTIKVKRSKRTYLTYATLLSLAHSYRNIQNKYHQSLQVAEFGVGRGGSATILAWMVNRYKGHLTLYDVFSRIPAPTDQDGERAQQRYDYILHQEGDKYYGNIANLQDVVLTDLKKVCSLELIDVVQGKYEDTLPTLEDKKKFNLVHIDCDWYESSITVYKYLHSRLAEGAIIQIDDYSNWEGSKRAFQETDWLHAYHRHLVDGALVVDTYRKK